MECQENVTSNEYNMSRNVSLSGNRFGHFYGDIQLKKVYSNY